MLARFLCFSLFLSILLAISLVDNQLAAQEIAWTVVWGQSDVNEIGFDIAADRFGSVYVFGSDRGPIGGNPASFILKHDQTGEFQWTVRDSAIQDFAYGGAVDHQGNAFMSGGSSMAGQPNAIVSKYGPTGDRQWIRQFGTALPDWASHVQVDLNNDYYSVGQTLGSYAGPNAGDFDIFVRKTTASGGEIWKTQIGTDGVDVSGNFVVDSMGNSYLTGSTDGSTDQDGVFATKIGADGQHEWTRLIGSEQQEAANGISLDQKGNVYITGHTTGDLGSSNVGGEDFFFSKIDSNGNLKWTRQIGTSGDDIAADILVDDIGNIHIAGSTDGVAFLNRYDLNGALIWNTSIARADLELNIQGLTMGVNGEFYLGGYSYDPLTGDRNVFLARVNAVPEPCSIVVAVPMMVFAIRRRRYRHKGPLNGETVQRIA